MPAATQLATTHRWIKQPSPSRRAPLRSPETEDNLLRQVVCWFTKVCVRTSRRRRSRLPVPHPKARRMGPGSLILSSSSEND